MRVPTLLTVLALTLIPASTLAQQTWSFTKTSSQEWPSVTYPRYNTSPTVLDVGSSQHYFDIWTCNNTTEIDGHGRDVIKHSAIRKNSNQTIPESYFGTVLKPTAIGTGDYRAYDSHHTCAPSVVKHGDSVLTSTFTSSTGISVSELWLMYYECGPQYFDLDQAANATLVRVDGLAHICLAVSPDGITWYKHSKPPGASVPEFRLQDQDSQSYYPTPVISSSEAETLCNTQPPSSQNGYLHLLDTNSCPDPQGQQYGAGHPSAMIIDVGGARPWVRLFYSNPSHDLLNDTCSNPNNKRTFHVADSYDGLTFPSRYTFTIDDVICTPLGPGPSLQVSYDPVQNAYFGLTTKHGLTENYVAVGDNPPCGVCIDSAWKARTVIGKARLSHSVRGQAAFATDVYGHFDSTAVTIFSTEHPTDLPSADIWRDLMIYRLKGSF